MSLPIGRRIHSSNWRELPMGADIIVSVEIRALREGQPLLRGNGPLFEWQPGVPVDNKDKQDNDDAIPHKDTPFLEVHDDTNGNKDPMPDNYEVDDDMNPDDVTIHTIEEEDPYNQDIQPVIHIHPLHEKPRSAQPELREPRSVQQVEVTLDLPIPTEGVKRSRRYRPPPSSHLNSYEKEFQNENKDEALQFTLVGT